MHVYCRKCGGQSITTEIYVIVVRKSTVTLIGALYHIEEAVVNINLLSPSLSMSQDQESIKSSVHDRLVESGEYER